MKPIPVGIVDCVLHRCMQRTCASVLIGFNRQEHATRKTTISEEEVQKFGAQSSMWWDVINGPMRPLHSFNHLRVPFIRDRILNQMAVGHGVLEAEIKTIKNGPQPLQGVRLVDVGCGAGILSESLARIGANVTGLDASPELVAVAKYHATLDSSLSGHLHYHCTTVEEHAEFHCAEYDALVCSEVVEHVSDPAFFVEKCIKLVKPGGSLLYTTINKTYFSWLVLILMAENILKMVPKGTHQYGMLMPPGQLEKFLVSNGCSVRCIQGFLCKPNGHWMVINSVQGNYGMHAVKK